MTDRNDDYRTMLCDAINELTTDLYFGGDYDDNRLAKELEELQAEYEALYGAPEPIESVPFADDGLEF